MQKLSINILILFFCLLVSCRGKQADHTLNKGKKVENIYAKGFAIYVNKDYKRIDIRDPWDTTRVLNSYILIDNNIKTLPSNLPKAEIVRVPLEKLVVYTSVHASIVELLGADSNIVGVCESRYIDSDKLQARLKDGSLADLGESTSPNIEKIIDIGTQAIIASPFENSGYGPAEKLKVPIIEGADYMENHPLGRVEWLKLYAYFLGKEKIADSIFDATCLRYNTLKTLTQKVEKRPSVLLERMYSGQWFVPAGKSITATLIKDAGANYIFASIAQSGNLAFSLETILDKGINADFWLFKYNLTSGNMTYDMFLSDNNAYGRFDAFKNKNIYVCNTGKVPYYEDIPMHPDRLLKDYISIFHPHLLQDYKYLYFHKMQDKY